MENRVITIGRQFGSGGREIGQLLSESLGIPFYDRDLIELAVEKSGIDLETLEKHDEKPVNRWFYSIPSQPNRLTGYGMPIADTLFVAQSEIIRELAQKESCIIIGRCADYVLREHPDLISLFILAPMEERIKRIMRRYSLDDRQAKEFIRRTDKERASYYNYYTEKKWSGMESYHFCIDSSIFGVSGTVEKLLRLAG